MRFLFFIILFFVSSYLYGQEIELNGKYGATFIGGETIEFIGKDSFSFHGFYCTYGIHGKGVCNILNNYLHLYFEKSEKERKMDSLRRALILVSKYNPDIANLNIICLTNDGIPIPSMTVQIENKYNAKIGAVTDTLGKADFKVSKNLFPLIIRTSSIAIEPNFLKIDSVSNYSIKLFHNQDPSLDKVINNGEVWVYEIKDLSDNFIVMRLNKSKDEFRKYIKRKD